MKILFLDIDGVLNNDFTKEKYAGFCGIDSRLRDMFLAWLNSRDVSIILSSSWRIPSAFGDFKAELNRNGIEWIDETPIFTHLGYTKRGIEIQASLDTYEPDKYAILDDYNPSEFLKHQRPFLVQTSARLGLEPKKLKKLDQLLEVGDDYRRNLQRQGSPRN